MSSKLYLSSYDFKTVGLPIIFMFSKKQLLLSK
jgi:hypothetical protein